MAACGGRSGRYHWPAGGGPVDIQEGILGTFAAAGLKLVRSDAAAIRETAPHDRPRSPMK